MPVKLGNIDVIIGVDLLSKYHAVIVCDEKIVRVPYDAPILFTKDVMSFWHIQLRKETKGEVKKERIEDVHTVRDFLKLRCDLLVAPLEMRRMVRINCKISGHAGFNKTKFLAWGDPVIVVSE
ncbi:hypothetical protein Tco_0511879 [Tanacetum coccineum]